MTLTGFLLERIAEEEQRARALADAAWPTSVWVTPESDGQKPAVSIGTYGAKSYCVMWFPTHDLEWSWVVPRTAVEVWSPADPARVLAECEAKRRIVEYHRAEERENRSEWEDDRCIVCTETGDWDLPMLKWPCPTVLALALPYASHPDFQREWAL